MKTLLVGINAKYIHSNLAIRYLKEYAQSRGVSGICLAEFTINQRPEQILPEIFKECPDVIGFSCYIWNFSIVCRLAAELKKVLPQAFIFFGGPEVSYNAAQVLERTSADLVVHGEGEETVFRLLQALESKAPLQSIPGITCWVEGSISENPDMPPISMDDLPFVYHNMTELEHKIIYFESSRGCPFSCQYCLSCNDHNVRFMSLPKVFRALDFFLSQKVRQVKFVDRTFNCDKQYAMSIWQYLAEHDNGITNFHFEIAAELLDGEILSFLKTVRRGQFQFEIGVQSTYPPTLKAIRRITKLSLLRHIVGELKQGNNIHLHLDLIIGLPLESYEQFQQSFNDVYSLSPDQLQVGFLKLLKGSGLYETASQYGIVCSEFPPYEVLYTRELPYEKLLKLKMLEEMVETYYNSGRFQQLISYLVGLFPTPFDCFEALASFYEEQGYHLVSHSNVEYYTILYRFFQTLNRGDSTRFQWLAKHDLYSHEKAKKIPEWLTVSLEPEYRGCIYRFFDDPDKVANYLPQLSGTETKLICRQAHIEVFPSPEQEVERVAVLYSYRQRDLLGNAQTTILPMKELEDDGTN
ncbi:coproporphyrinogen III oxidase [uncultured Ruminococcus sp.]|uniref:B12-binding domain-containing radical SAM protein n=1 Tax=Massiliimalia timonensis TaxID=1987501 RepID=A0A8J6P6F7_9FIRM|nr:B12-binding domain-containing radical SAM protein [Massiliimalia timonensis]MBC8610095.1 B12-binding domain-containing radical SAM protein [Massiliimalia timonensis]SCH10500.1 coproporphyrinogen III oxidase [uncultured Ruminococcus sp.]SCH78631.1 coproporphyrinogen III oxidase [uncultured Clostridium sp.]